jgi:two-component system, NarL family, sensor histidine kinase UhpB
MSTHSDLKILMLEDVPEEAEVLERELRKAGLTFNARRVQTRADFAAALEEFAPDLILADAKLPAFDGRSALQMVRDGRTRIPVIMVTGALGDEAAVEYLLAGASDYVLKDRPARLGPAVVRALQDEEDRRGREAAENERKRLERALREAAAEERGRLAKELHDGLGQELTGFALLADGLAKQIERSGSPVPTELERLASMARRAITTCRDIARGLSPLSGARSGLTEALRDLTDRANGPPGPRVSLCVELHDPLTTSREVSEHLYRIAQEGLTNAMKHARAETVEVRLDVDAHTVRMRVLDDGVGPPDPAVSSSGLGLKTMRDRAAAIGGRLSVVARHERGTAVICEAPQGPRPPAVGA